MSSLAAARGSVVVLWKRDVSLFLRQRSRVIGGVLTSLLLWLAIGAGIAPSFSLAAGDVGYMEYFFPGVIAMTILQVSISATMSVIEDRRQGFLQGVLVAPGPRWALVLGKTFGSTTVALLHAVPLVLLAPLAGFSLGSISWIGLGIALALTALALTGMGFMLAWILDSVQGYHIVMNLVLFPLWLVSGAMFPAERLHPVLATVVFVNPMSYAVSATRRAFYGGELPVGVGLPGIGPGWEYAVTAVTAVALLAAAAWVASRRAASD